MNYGGREGSKDGKVDDGKSMINYGMKDKLEIDMYWYVGKNTLRVDRGKERR